MGLVLGKREWEMEQIFTKEITKRINAVDTAHLNGD